MRVIFMGTPEFSVPVVRALAAAGHGIAAVYTQPPRPAGRGHKLRPSAVQIVAEEMGLEVRDPLNFRSPSDVAAFGAINADVAVVVAYGLILPAALLAAPRWGCLNIHASLLPRWRGAAPIHRAIMAGDEKTGISIMQMEAGLDTGPVVLRREIGIGASDTTADLDQRLAGLGGTAILEALARIETLRPEPQAQNGVTYAAKIDKAESRINWTRPAVEIDRHVRGLSPFPGAWTMLGQTRLKLLASTVSEGAGAPGEILDQRLTIACGAGAIRALTVQPSGKPAMTAADFLRGHAVQAGDRVD